MSPIKQCLAGQVHQVLAYRVRLKLGLSLVTLQIQATRYLVKHHPQVNYLQLTQPLKVKNRKPCLMDRCLKPNQLVTKQMKLL